MGNRPQKRRKHPKSNKASKSTVSEIDLPQAKTGQDSFDQLMEIIKHSAQVHEDAYNESLTNLQNIIVRLHPLQLITQFAITALLSAISKDHNEWKDPSAVLQHHAEVLQALVLRHQLTAFEMRAVRPSDFESARMGIQSLTQSFHGRRIRQLLDRTDSGVAAQRTLIEQIRMDTQVVRNWGFAYQVRRIVAEIHDPIDHHIQQQLGYRVVSLVTMLVEINDRYEERLLSYWNQLRPILSLRSSRRLVESYIDTFPLADDDANALHRFSREYQHDVDEVRSVVLGHSYTRLHDFSEFSVQDFLSAYPGPIAAETMTALLNNWSHSFGDLNGTIIDHIFMDNPIWRKPLIKVDEQYYLTIPGLLISFLLEIVETQTSTDEWIHNLFLRHRGLYLEQEAERLLKVALPSASSYVGSQWSDNGTQYESDVIVTLDSVMILIEAKSGSTAPAARRGAPKSVTRTVRNLVVEPARQAKRIEEHLLSSLQTHQLPNKRGTVNQIDTTNIRTVIRLNVLLQPIGDLHTRWNAMVEAGLIDKAEPPILSLTIADLENIIEILQRPIELIHFLLWRTAIQVSLSYVADELDLLTMYTQEEFQLRMDDPSSTRTVLSGVSLRTESYLLQKHLNTSTGRPPRRRYTRWWSDLLDRFEELELDGWVDLCLILLDVPYQRQKRFEYEAKRIRRLVRRDWALPEHKSQVLFTTGNSGRLRVIVGFAYKSSELSNQNRDHMIRKHGESAIGTTMAYEALVIGFDADQPGYPYDMMGLFRADVDT